MSKPVVIPDKDGVRAPVASRVGADEALESLIGQFTDPLVFLRELVQNSLDAAATRIDIDVAFAKRTGDRGLMTITVRDNGEGMNERIIDDYLLTLFRSTKEDDLTKIGKFGIGFVSIFAIEPELVVLETGQAGESWRLLFYPDRSIEKIRLDEADTAPVEGTSIAVHKRAKAGEFAATQRRGKEAVRYFCKYADAEIYFDGEKVGEPFGVDALLAVTHAEPGTDIATGFAPPAAPGSPEPGPGLYGFYNRGLTLMEGPHLPGGGLVSAGDLAGIHLRIRSRYIEHTLTRDNVKQDESFAKLMALVRTALSGPLRHKLTAHLRALAEHASGAGPDPGSPDLSLALRYARLPCMDLTGRAADGIYVPTWHHGALRVGELRTRKDSPWGKAGQVLAADEASPLTEHLAQDRVPVVRLVPGMLEFLRGADLALELANEALYLAMPVAVADEASGPVRGPFQAASVRPWLTAICELLQHAKIKVSQVVLGDLAYPGSPVASALYVRQTQAFSMSRIGKDDRAGLFGGARDIVLNISHTLVRSAVALAGRDQALAAQLVAQAIGTAEGISAERISSIASQALLWRAHGDTQA